MVANSNFRRVLAQRLRSTTRGEAGLTLIELIVACGILVILAASALPVTKYMVIRPKEAELRRDLREMRDAIDRYKDVADKNLVRVQVGSEGYPPAETVTVYRYDDVP